MARTPLPNRRPVRRTLLAATGAGLAGLLLAGCGGPALGGSAAVVGDQRITDAQVAQDVAEVHAATGVPADAPDQDLTQKTVERLVTQALVTQVAEQQGVSVTQGEIDSLRAQAEESQGGAAGLEKYAAEQGIPASNLDEVIRMQLLVPKIGAKLVPGGDQQAQGQAAFDAVVKHAQEQGVTVSPRFGEWVPDKVRMASPPADVAVPAPSDGGAATGSAVPVPAAS